MLSDYKLKGLVTIAVTLCVIHAAPTQSPSINNQATCTTQQCVATAAGFINDMDPEVDPCSDFRQFTCGGFDNKNEIPSDFMSSDYFTFIYSDNSRIIRQISDPTLGKAPNATSGDEAEQAILKKLHDFYASCIDESTILKTGRTPLVDQVQKIHEILPDNPSGVDKTALTKVLGHTLKLGFPEFVIFYVGPGYLDPDINTLQMFENGLGLPAKSLYQIPAIVELYQGVVAQMFQIILGDEDVANRTEPLTPKDIKQEWLDAAKDVVAFESELAAIGTEIVDQRDPLKSNNPRTIDELSAMVPSIDWNLLVQDAFPTGVDTNFSITVNSPKYVTDLGVILNNTTTTTLQRYFTWSAIRNLAKGLGEPYNQPLKALLSALNGVSATAKVDRWKTCVADVDSSLGEIAGHYFVKERFKGNSREDFMAVIDSLRATYLKVMPLYNWLDKSTLDGALTKLKAMEALVGYSTGSPDVSSTKSLQEYYKDYNVTRDDYFGNIIRNQIWSNAKYASFLGTPVDRKKMLTYPETVNAFYTPSGNQILFPAGILQSPYYQADNPEYVKYGFLGVIAAHEITHGFDSMGSHFDSKGALRNWWTNSTRAAFNEKAQCFVGQYGNFTIKGPDGKDYNIDGALTLNENIADNGGLKQAFHTWQDRYKSDPTGRSYKNFKLPGLDNYTPEQLFFISYGRLWCQKLRPEAGVQQLKTDTHSPAQWRINGAVMNLPEFSEAFKCKAGSAMNPTKRCELW
ncbi:hypothetical protein FBU30_006029 [Linnemannia zychae]|nr:hypothetical protein FBU30_006029 [Linnemannia zychae]